VERVWLPSWLAEPDDVVDIQGMRVLAKLGATQGLWFDEPNDRGGVDTVVGCSIDVSRVLRHL